MISSRFDEIQHMSLGQLILDYHTQNLLLRLTFLRNFMFKSDILQHMWYKLISRRIRRSLVSQISKCIITCLIIVHVQHAKLGTRVHVFTSQHFRENILRMNACQLLKTFLGVPKNAAICYGY